MDKVKCTELSKKILELVGGKENVTHLLHCATRLRFNLKNYDLAKVDGLNALDGVVKCLHQQGQLQVIIGGEVAQVYDEVCRLGEFEKKPEVSAEDQQQEKQRLTPKKVLLNIMDAVSGCVNPILPIIIAAGMVKLIITILGPSMLGIVSEQSDFYTLFTFVGDSGFYFFTVYIGWAAARKFGCSQPIALLLGAMLLHPTFVNIVAEGAPFTVYGIPVVLANYSSNLIPMILIVWVMSYIEKWLKKVIPSSMKPLLVPTLTLLIMLPLAFCVLGPVGTVLGQAIAAFMEWMYSVFGGFSTAIIAAFWIFLIATGLHQALIAIALGLIATAGYDDTIMVGALVAMFPLYAVCASYTIRAKTAEQRSMGVTYFITAAVGGIGEPAIFGILFEHTRAFLYMGVGGFVGGLIAGMFGAKVYFFSGLGNAVCLLGFAGEDPNSIVIATISCAIAFVITFVLGLIFGYDNKPVFKRKTAREAA